MLKQLNFQLCKLKAVYIFYFLFQEDVLVTWIHQPFELRRIKLAVFRKLKLISLSFAVKMTRKSFDLSYFMPFCNKFFSTMYFDWMNSWTYSVFTMFSQERSTFAATLLISPMSWKSVWILFFGNIFDSDGYQFFAD